MKRVSLSGVPQKKVAIVGVTGIVGQTVLRLLHGRSEFDVCELAASDRCAGRFFGDVCAWHDPDHKAFNEKALVKMIGVSDISAPYVISCVPAHVGQVIEPELAKKGLYVFSNASCFRMDSAVPLIVPEINARHIDLCDQQKWLGSLIKNPNCSVAGIALALAPLLDMQNSMQHISIVTLQAVSGAGYPGLSAMDMLGNSLPDIPGEWQKIAPELQKILSSNGHTFKVPITTHVHRVPVVSGHVATLHIAFQKNVNLQIVQACYHKWNQKYSDLFVMHHHPDRPQVRRDLLPHDMRVHIGQIRHGGHQCMLGMTILSHNLIRGAAGSIIANMDLFMQRENEREKAL